MNPYLWLVRRLPEHRGHCSTYNSRSELITLSKVMNNLYKCVDIEQSTTLLKQQKSCSVETSLNEIMISMNLFASKVDSHNVHAHHEPNSVLNLLWEKKLNNTSKTVTYLRKAPTYLDHIRSFCDICLYFSKNAHVYTKFWDLHDWTYHKMLPMQSYRNLWFDAGKVRRQLYFYTRVSPDRV